MKYMVETLASYITQEVEKKGGILRFVLPSYPSGLLVKIGEELEERFSRMRERRVRFKYGIAYRLGKKWLESGDPADERNYTVVLKKGWYNENNNLTSLRNEVKGPGDDCLVVLLAGYDHIDDRASLQDFFRLEQQTIWEICLEKKFNKWIHNCLCDYVNLDDAQNDFKRINELFKNLYDYGFTDLVEISNYLEARDFRGIMTGNDAYRLILDYLYPFKLPCMVGLASRSIKKPVAGYIKSAREFFNYSMFLKASERKKALQRISDYKKESHIKQLDSDILGTFKTVDDMLQALEDYVKNRSISSREKLLTADFTYIQDKILGYRKKNGLTVRDPKAKKLHGLPPEVFLHALWFTLGEFKKKVKKRSLLVEEIIKDITIRSTMFRHDFDTSDEDDIHDSAELAEKFLHQVLGGVDEYLESKVLLQLGDRNNPLEVRLKSLLCPGKNDILKYKKNSKAEPWLKFEVIIATNDGSFFRREFLWSLPQNHQSRLLVDLYKWALNGYKNSGDALPVFAVPYMAEIFMARDETEVNRLLATAMQERYARFIDLLKGPGMDEMDEVKRLLGELSICYQNYLNEFRKSGFFNALQHKYWKLREVYCSAFEKYLQKSAVSTMGPLLFKAFMVVTEEGSSQTNWVWQEYLQSAIITPLHPALLEMLDYQHAFLCESFCVYAKEALEESNDKMFAEKRWAQVVDLSRIQWPVFGILKNHGRELDTNIRSYGYIHLVGEHRADSALITSRLLLEYDNEEDDDISDTELFHETRNSRLIKEVLLDYRTLHPYANEGISIGAFCGGEIQPVIAGIDAYLAAIPFDERLDNLYSLKLIIYSDGKDDSSVMRWVNAWKDRWQAAELSPGKRHYSDCRISIAYRVVSRDDDMQFINLLRDTDLDVLLFVDFMTSCASRFELLGDDSYARDAYRKFPVLEKACCKLTGGGRDNQRQRVINNQRFRLGALHAEVMAHIRNGPTDPANKHAVISNSDFQPWMKIIDAAHECSAWVVCIDQFVDEQLLYRVETDGVNAREIIGFGTGVGPHGENNYTISTEQFSMVDIKEKIGSQVSILMGPWEGDVCHRIADCLVQEAAHMAGLSVIKATGPSQYVRDYIAYALVRKLLPRDDNSFCDEIVSLDAYRHWFNDAEDSKRPDLLRLRANIVNGFFHIDAQLVECKLAQYSEGHLEKARQQIENGLKQLVPCFRPREGVKPEGIDDRPDQRYWWMQLHRLIASRGETTRPKYQETLLALERLSEGCYDISWQAAAVAFWTDVNMDAVMCNSEWNYTLDGRELIISVASAGKDFVREVCLDGVTVEIFCSKSKLAYEFTRLEKTIGVAGETGKEATKDYEEEDSEDAQSDHEIGDGVGKDDSSVSMVRRIPERVFLGSVTAGSRDVYWEFGHPDLPNRHLLVFGASGGGKTYTIQALLCELSKSGQNSLIVDYTNGFTNNQLEPVVKEKLKPRQHIILKQPLAVNPFRRQSQFIDDMEFKEDPANTAQRVSGVFAEVYQLGDQQKSALYNAIRDGVSQEGNNFNFSELIKRLDAIREAGGPFGASAASVISKIQPFVDMNPFGEEDPESWEKLFSDINSRCHIIQLAGFMKDAARLITEFSLIDLYWYYRAKGSKDNPKVIVLDEIQNLDHRLDSPLGQFLTEGRKFGVSLILATQTLSNLNRDERDRLFQASHKLFFKPADTEIRSFASILADSTGERMDEWVHRLSSLKRGECYSLGHALNEVTGKLEVNRWFKIRIKALEERF